MPRPPITAWPDHLLLLAPSLASAAHWCQSTLGVRPTEQDATAELHTRHWRLPLHAAELGHAHALHLRIIAPQPPAAWPAAYTPQPALYSAQQLARAQTHGPQLIGWAARVPCIAQAALQLARLEVDCGEILCPAPAQTPAGKPWNADWADRWAEQTPPWRIAIPPRADVAPAADVPHGHARQGPAPCGGLRHFGPCLPLLVQWANPPEPPAAAPALRLRTFGLHHPRPRALTQACAALGLPPLLLHRAPRPALHVQLDTPMGVVTLPFAPPSVPPPALA